MIVTASQAVDGSIEITFTDTGQGIPREQLPHVFERFYRGADDKTGSGLGLAITREIVWAHGGDASVASTTGMGTRFIISLPTVTRPQLQWD